MLKLGLPGFGCPRWERKPEQVGEEHGKGGEKPACIVEEPPRVFHKLAEGGGQHGPAEIVGIAQEGGDPCGQK